MERVEGAAAGQGAACARSEPRAKCSAGLFGRAEPPEDEEVSKSFLPPFANAENRALDQQIVVSSTPIALAARSAAL